MASGSRETNEVWWADSEMDPAYSCLSVLTTLDILTSLSVGKVVMLHNTQVHLVRRLSPLLFWIKQVDMLGRSVWQRTENSPLANSQLGTQGGLWLKASKKLRSSVQQAACNWVLTTMWVWKQILPQLRWDCSLSQHLDCSLWILQQSILLSPESRTAETVR